MTRGAFALFVSFVFSGPIFGAGPDHPYGIAIRPDAEVQAWLAKASEAFWNKRLPLLERLQAVGTLEDFARDERRLFEQLFYFYCKQDARDKDAEPEQVFTRWLVSFFRIPPTTVIETAAPYLESPEPRLRSIAESFLGHFVDDESYYVLYLGARRDDPPPGVVAILFQEFADRTLGALSEAFNLSRDARRSLLWAEHVINDAIWKKEHQFADAFAQARPQAMAELEMLSQHERWPVRYYAAKRLSLFPEFRTTPMVERLQRDEHELVRGAIPPPDAQADNPPGKR